MIPAANKITRHNETMLWQTYDQTRSVQAQLTADKAERTAEGAADRLAALQNHVERLSLACQALWELLRDRTELTEEDLEAKVVEVDMRDGRLDAKIGTTQQDCPACGRKTNSTRSICIMCGAPLKRPHQFEG